MTEVQDAVGEAIDDFPILPYEDICIIDPEVEEVSRGGIVLAGGAQKMPCGRVIAAGPGRWYHSVLDASGHNSAAFFVPNPVKVGDFVIFGKYQSGGEPILWMGKRYIMARAGDLGGRTRDNQPVNLRLDI